MMDQFKVFALVSTLLICLAQKGLCDERQHNGEFKCPEEFGYYPHPSDCSQYYVCVFGGALLESCTGGLMYSHELQTCDWPRNVGCGAEAAISQSDINQENALPLTRTSERPRHPTPQPQRVTPSVFTGQKQTQDQQQINDQHIIKQQQLYDEDDYRAIEDDGDRQQRVYRGQPSTLGQVARDRDGLTNHRNVISPFVGVEKNKQFQLQNQNFRNDTGQLHVKQRFKRQTRLSHSGMTRIRPTDTTVSTTHYALRRVPQNQVIAKPSSYIPITNMDNPQKQKRCLYKSQRYPGLLIPCPSSNNYWGGPPMSSSSVLENEETNDTENSEDDKEAVDDKGDYSDYPENENQEDYEEEESPLQHDLKNADKAFEHLVNRVRCRNKNSCENKNNKEQEDLENQEESQEESPDSKEEEHKQPPKSTPKPKPKPSTTPKPEPLPKLNALRPLTVAHNYRPANFTKLRPPPPDPPRPHYPHPKHDDGDRSDAEEQEEEEDSQESSQLEDVEEYNENDDLADDEYYYDDEEDYDVKPKKPQIPQKLAQIDNMKFSGEGDEPSESISKDTVLKNVSKTIDLQKPNESSSLTLNSYNAITSRPKPYDSAAEAYSRIKDKNKFHDQQTAMQMTVYDTTVSSSVFEDKKKKLKIPTTTTNWTTVSPAKMQSLKPTVRTTARTTLFKRPQQISVPSYAIEQTVQPVTTARTTTTITVRNVSQPFDPTFYNVYDDDSDIYKDVDYGQFTLSSVNNNNNRLKPQPDPFRVSVPVSQATPRYQANTFVPEYNLKVTEEEPQRDQQTKATYRGRVRGSATYTTASSNDIDRGTPLSGTRPTLKPSTSIVSKASEFIDVYKYPPKRPDPIYPTPQPDKTAAKCRKDVCQLPDCSCGGKEIPGDLTPEETPQMVLLTFDDSVNDLNKGLYTDLFEKGRVNPNGCPISATFYVSHEWTDYSQVQNLYAAGHEMASHSVSHSFGEQFSQKKWTKEIVGQREILSAYGGVHQEDIRGMRAPFLAVGGNKMFKMLYDSNFTYDSSMPIYENKPPSWPYTLDYKLFHDCMIPPCPTRSYPGVWEVPMVMWQDLNGGRCSMGDACSNPPDAEGVHKMLMKNFDRHFTSNRAPFGLFYHAAWFTQPHHKEGFIQFLDTIVNMPEVWIVTNWQALQWVRDPTSISRLQSFSPFHCDYSDRPKKCNNPKVCNLWHKSGVRYMRTCQPCPDVYPWTGKTGIRSSRIDDGSE
ncbi:uncharacterized protein LOC126910517 isoform X4 [Daktulosphaira vitifoliae]|uniref:uncharacterized protein LOC126910517 isoform X4 n=1 Tax=Daktulosphaira vitifoliae TaxID=58002 RepID=UPI0021AADB2A|nr:uncharacterized protein LOC126910517 isoform X4 [Daktulosphaira vitifoliae]